MHEVRHKSYFQLTKRHGKRHQIEKQNAGLMTAAGGEAETRKFFTARKVGQPSREQRVAKNATAGRCAIETTKQTLCILLDTMCRSLYTRGMNTLESIWTEKSHNSAYDVRAAEAALDEAKAQRDATIRAALKDGVSVKALTTHTGLSRERIYQIKGQS